jgi:hypothetical protein
MTMPESSTKQRSLMSTEFQPTDEQLARAAATQRFIRLYVYLPMGLVTAVVTLITLYLLYLAFFPPTPDIYIFLSGLADFVMVMFLIPVVTIFGLLLTAGIGGTIYYWYVMDEAERPIPPAPAYGRIRTLLWQIDSLIVRYRPKLLEAETQIARPVIQFNAWLVFIPSWLRSVKGWFGQAPKS